MKQIVSLVIGVILMASFLIACGESPKPAPEPKAAAPAAAAPKAAAPAAAAAPTAAPSSKAAPAAPSQKPKSAPVTLKAVTFQPMNHPTVANFRLFLKELEKEANGELIVNLVGGPEAIPAKELVQALRSGSIDMAFTVSGDYSGLIPEAMSFSLSKFTPEEERKAGFYDVMAELHREKNMFYLGRGDYLGFEYFSLYTKKKLNSPKDFSGLKMRAASTYIPLMKKLNVTPVTIPLTDMYAALERGMVEGTGIPIGSYVSYKLYEVSKYVIDHGFYGTNATVQVNLDAWNKIPKHLQDLLIKVQLQEERKWPGRSQATINESRKKASDGGAEFIKFSPADAKWYIDTAYEEQWESVKKTSRPEYFERMKKALGQ